MKPYYFNSLFAMTPSELSAKFNEGCTTNTMGINMREKEQSYFVMEEKEKPYFVMEGDWYVFSDRFASVTEADDFAHKLAQQSPDCDFTVCKQDRRFRGEASVKVSSRFVS